VHASAHEPATLGVRGPPGAGQPLPGSGGAALGAAPRVLRPRARAVPVLSPAPTASSLHSVRRRV
jgi:hypothetical protein